MGFASKDDFSVHLYSSSDFSVKPSLWGGLFRTLTRKVTPLVVVNSRQYRSQESGSTAASPIVVCSPKKQAAAATTTDAAADAPLPSASAGTTTGPLTVDSNNTLDVGLSLPGVPCRQQMPPHLTSAFVFHNLRTGEPVTAFYLERPLHDSRKECVIPQRLHRRMTMGAADCCRRQRHRDTNRSFSTLHPRMTRSHTVCDGKLSFFVVNSTKQSSVMPQQTCRRRSAVFSYKSGRFGSGVSPACLAGREEAAHQSARGRRRSALTYSAAVSPRSCDHYAFGKRPKRRGSAAALARKMESATPTKESCPPFATSALSDGTLCFTLPAEEAAVVAVATAAPSPHLSKDRSGNSTSDTAATAIQTTAPAVTCRRQTFQTRQTFQAEQSFSRLPSASRCETGSAAGGCPCTSLRCLPDPDTFPPDCKVRRLQPRSSLSFVEHCVSPAETMSLSPGKVAAAAGEEAASAFFYDMMREPEYLSPILSLRNAEAPVENELRLDEASYFTLPSNAVGEDAFSSCGGAIYGEAVDKQSTSAATDMLLDGQPSPLSSSYSQQERVIFVALLRACLSLTYGPYEEQRYDHDDGRHSSQPASRLLHRMVSDESCSETAAAPAEAIDTTTSESFAAVPLNGDTGTAPPFWTQQRLWWESQRISNQWPPEHIRMLGALSLILREFVSIAGREFRREFLSPSPRFKHKTSRSPYFRQASDTYSDNFTGYREQHRRASKLRRFSRPPGLERFRPNNGLTARSSFLWMKSASIVKPLEVLDSVLQHWHRSFATKCSTNWHAVLVSASAHHFPLAAMTTRIIAKDFSRAYETLTEILRCSCWSRRLGDLSRQIFHPQYDVSKLVVPPCTGSKVMIPATDLRGNSTACEGSVVTFADTASTYRHFGGGDFASDFARGCVHSKFASIRAEAIGTATPLWSAKARATPLPSASETNCRRSGIKRAATTATPSAFSFSGVPSTFTSTITTHGGATTTSTTTATAKSVHFSVKASVRRRRNSHNKNCYTAAVDDEDAGQTHASRLDDNSRTGSISTSQNSTQNEHCSKNCPSWSSCCLDDPREPEPPQPVKRIRQSQPPQQTPMTTQHFAAVSCVGCQRRNGVVTVYRRASTLPIRTAAQSLRNTAWAPFEKTLAEVKPTLPLEQDTATSGTSPWPTPFNSAMTHETSMSMTASESYSVEDDSPTNCSTLISTASSSFSSESFESLPSSARQMLDRSKTEMAPKRQHVALHALQGIYVYTVDDFEDFYALGPQIGAGGEGSVYCCIPLQLLRSFCGGQYRKDWHSIWPQEVVANSAGANSAGANSVVANSVGAHSAGAHSAVAHSAVAHSAIASSNEAFNEASNALPSDEHHPADADDVTGQRASLLNDLCRMFCYAVKATPKASSRSTMDVFAMAHFTASIRHPLVVSHRAFYEDAKNYFLVMDYIRGPALFDLLRDAGGYFADESVAANYLVQILLALRYIHAEGLIHRDIKLENFVCCCSSDSGDSVADGGFINGDMVQLKLIDFGISIYETDIPHTTPDGTPAYMAPETTLRQKLPYAYSAAIDLWGAGICMSYLLTGSSPFGNKGIGPLVAAEAPSEDLGASSTTCMHPPWRRFRMCSDWLSSPRVRQLSDEAKDLLFQLLQEDSALRLTAAAALKQPWVQHALKRCPSDW